MWRPVLREYMMHSVCLRVHPFWSWSAQQSVTIIIVTLSPAESSRCSFSFLFLYFFFQPVLIVFAPTQTILFKFKTGCGQTATMTEVTRSLITTIGSALFHRLRGNGSLRLPMEKDRIAEDNSSLWNRCWG